MIHGLTGSEQSSYVVSLARLLLEHGHCVLRLNLRGAGASRATCAGKYYAGRSEDLRTLMALLPDELVRDGVVGGVFTGRSIAVEVSRRARPGDAASRGGATVSAPIDLAAAGRNLLRPRNFLYHRFVLGHMKRNAKGEGSALSPGYRAALHKVKTVWEYDDVFVAPRHGFADAEDYYERSKPLRFMDAIRIPPLLVAAVNDPWVPFESYRDYDWAANPALVPLLSQDGGGHIGFQEAGSSLRWSDLAVAKFFGQAAIVERRPARRSTLIPSTG